jgi:hypothetical protein
MDAACNMHGTEQKFVQALIEELGKVRHKFENMLIFLKEIKRVDLDWIFFGAK